METYQEKISLLQEMIDFALVDGALHDREYDFLEIVSPLSVKTHLRSFE
jgi:hypothetical protein